MLQMSLRSVAGRRCSRWTADFLDLGFEGVFRVHLFQDLSPGQDHVQIGLLRDQTAQLGDEVDGLEFRMHLVFEMLAAVGVTVHLDGLDGFTDIIWQLSRVQQGPIVPVDPRSEQLADTGSTDARGGQAHLVNVHFDLGKMGLGQLETTAETLGFASNRVPVTLRPLDEYPARTQAAEALRSRMSR